MSNIITTIIIQSNKKIFKKINKGKKVPNIYATLTSTNSWRAVQEVPPLTEM